MKKRPGTKPGRRSSKLFFGAYFVAAGAGVEAVVASVFVFLLFLGPLFFVTFLCVTFFFVVLAGVLVSVVVEAFSVVAPVTGFVVVLRSEEHTSELQSLRHLVC